MSNYRLISNKTKEETICSLVTIDGFDYYVSEEEIKINDPITDNYRIWFWRDDCSLLGRKKVICTNNSNIDIPQIIDEVEIICPCVGKDFRFEWIKGYNKAKETYQFTEEDVLNFTEYYKNNAWLMKNTNKEILDIWKEQQLKVLFCQ